jgi:23S rRNA (cytosine1962-C5)-methyltransferase
MRLLRDPNQKPFTLQLKRDLVRSVKRGHPWVYGEALRSLPPALPGSQAVLLDNRGGREIGRGFYDPDASIALRICSTRRGERLDNAWAARRFKRALALRKNLFKENSTAYRLFNGEGDGLPGLVCDRYDKAAVLALDGEGARKFWHAGGIAAWLVEHAGLETVYGRHRNGDGPGGRLVCGPALDMPVHFLENGMRFTADLERGQKTGFYLDQRQNRKRAAHYAPGARVLNLFGYSGAFSVYACLSGAEHVTTLDTARPALEAARLHWSLNGLPEERHELVRSDAFEFLQSAIEAKSKWDLVIIDPPSFAASRDALPGAERAYLTLISRGASATIPGGILALSSCSSHIGQEKFLSLCQEGLSKSRLKATVLGRHSLPPDHPVPLALPEFNYLKFVILRVNG